MAIPSSGYDIATISNPSSALTDFSLIVDLSHMSASWWAAVDTSDGTKGRASKSDGTTELACDWIDFNSTTETGILRVLYSGTLSSTGTQQIRIYPPMAANPSYAATDTYGQYNAYGSDIVAYYPLQSDFSNRISTSYQGVGYNLTAGGISGKFGSATSFNGSSSYIETMTTSEDIYSGASELYISAYANVSSLTSDQRLVSRWGALQQFIFWMDTGGAGDGWAGILKTGTVRAGEDDSNATTNWQFVEMSYDTSRGLRMFVDSVAGSTATASGAISSEDSVGTYIGRFGTTYYNGGIQDVTFYTSVPSDELRTHEYAQTSDNAAFWGTWAWESAGGNTYSVECSDGINLTDSISSSSIISAILSDGMIASDSPASSISMNISISDSVALNDAVSTFSQIQAIMSELATFTDSATTEKPPIEVLCSDSITLTDSTESSIIMQVVCPEGIVLSDFAQAVAIIASSCSDGVTLTDVFIDSTFLPQGIVTITGYSAKLKITFNVVSKLNITYEEIGKPTIIGGNA